MALKTRSRQWSRSPRTTSPTWCWLPEGDLSEDRLALAFHGYPSKERVAAAWVVDHAASGMHKVRDPNKNQVAV